MFNIFVVDMAGIRYQTEARYGSMPNIFIMNIAGIKYQAAVHHGDVIHYSWVLDCCKQKRLLHLQPKLVLAIVSFALSFWLF